MKEFDTAAVNNVHLFAEGIRLISERAFGGNKSFQEKAKEFGLISGDIKQGVQYVTGMPPLQSSPGNIPGPNQPVPSPTGGTAAPTGGSWFDNFTKFLSLNSGTKGALGDWWFDFGTKGTPTILHKNEAVVPFTEISKFFSKIFYFRR